MPPSLIHIPSCFKADFLTPQLDQDDPRLAQPVKKICQDVRKENCLDKGCPHEIALNALIETTNTNFKEKLKSKYHIHYIQIHIMYIHIYIYRYIYVYIYIDMFCKSFPFQSHDVNELPFCCWSWDTTGLSAKHAAGCACTRSNVTTVTTSSYISFPVAKVRKSQKMQSSLFIQIQGEENIGTQESLLDSSLIHNPINIPH